MDNKKIVCGIFLDLQKAFDNVNHHILLNKLQHYGICGTALRWFKSYPSSRSQYVSVIYIFMAWSLKWESTPWGKSYQYKKLAVLAQILGFLKKMPVQY